MRTVFTAMLCPAGQSDVPAQQEADVHFCSPVRLSHAIPLIHAAYG